VFYALHHRRPGDYETWKYLAPIQRAAWMRKTFENRTWGGRGDPPRMVTECIRSRERRLRFATPLGKESSGNEVYAFSLEEET
jgi:hypothetical protein